MKIKRLSSFSIFEQIILGQIYNKVKDTPKDGRERTFTGVFVHQNEKYEVTCDFLLKADYLEVEKLYVKCKDKVVVTTEEYQTGETVYKEIYLN